MLAPGDTKQVQAQFNQSNFFGEPRTVACLRKQAADHVPTLNEDGLIDRFILTQMDGKTNLGEVASKVVVQFPGSFATWEQALTRVGVIAVEHSQ